MTDLVGRWRSVELLTAATGWVDGVLARRGRRRGGPLTERKVRFWAGVYQVPLAPPGGGTRPGGTEQPDATDQPGGTDPSATDLPVERAFLKLANPGQAFEGLLLARLARLAPGPTVEPWAVEQQAGWWLLPDAGPTPAASDAVWVEAVELAAALQRACSDRLDELSMVPRLDAGDATGHVVDLVERLTTRPVTDPQHLGADEARTLLAGVPRLEEAMAVLAGSGPPLTLQPNDVHPGNAGRGPDGRLRLFDLGDAFLSHPWAVLSGPLRGVSGTRLREPLPDTAATRALLDRYAEHWPEVDRAARRSVLAAADRLGSVHRAASWERLLAPVDPQRLGVETPRLADWLRLALA